MSLTVDDITAISRAVAAEQSPAIEIVGVTSNLGGEARIELLLTIGEHSPPERILLNLSRSDRASFEQALREKLRGALVAQRT